MTCTSEIGKFKATIRHESMLGYREREVEFDVTWVSCGVYQMSYYRPRDAKPHYVIVVEDWYPPDTFISFTPEQFEKVSELYLLAPKHERNQCYEPFYEDYDLDNGMIDFQNDDLFQAYRDPIKDWVYLVNHMFTHGCPTTSTQVLGLSWTDFLRLKDLICSKKNEIFYSGCKISWPSKLVQKLNACSEAIVSETRS
jgi:hypothetical protein